LDLLKVTGAFFFIQPRKIKINILIQYQIKISESNSTAPHKLRVLPPTQQPPPPVHLPRSEGGYQGGGKRRHHLRLWERGRGGHSGDGGSYRHNETTTYQQV